MPEIIHLLSERVANQIAAGEVVQRPASALKELIENSIDAGADEIQILTKEGGKSLIQVIDNGIGMVPNDARLSFARHATSKILEAEDLFRIRTMGFRGEALASISAVSQVKMKTRKQEMETGFEIRVEGSSIIEELEITSPVGTSIEVRNLFFNIPARRNFLKSDLIELRYLIAEVEKISLNYPKIFFTFFHEGKELLHLPKGTYLQRIMHLFGNTYSEKVVPIEESTDILKISGFIGKPEYTKKTPGEQYFHLNGRFFKDRYLHHSLMNAYQEWIPAGHIPFYSIHLEVDPSKVDINVHPSKTEVKFQDEKSIYTLVQTAVKRSLGKFHLTPQIDFLGETGFEEMSVINRNLPINPPQSYVNPLYNPFLKEGQTKSPNYIPNNEHISLKQVSYTDNQLSEKDKILSSDNSIENSLNSYPYNLKDLEPDYFQEAEEAPSLFQEEDSLKREDRFIVKNQDKQAVFQIQKSFIVTSLFSGLIILDQQAAQERILYERYLKGYSGKIQASQQTLFPQTYTFSAQDSALVQSLLADIKTLGFEVREFGKNTYILEGIPTDLPFQGQTGIFEEILANYKENREIGKLNQRENLARSLSRRAAIRPGKWLSEEEMRLLIDELFACDSPNFSPSNKPTFITLNLSEIKKKF